MILLWQSKNLPRQLPVLLAAPPQLYRLVVEGLKGEVFKTRVISQSKHHC